MVFPQPCPEHAWKVWNEAPTDTQSRKFMCWKTSYELIPPLCPLAAVMPQPLKEGAQMYRYRQTKKWDCTYISSPDLQMCTQQRWAPRGPSAHL